MLYCSHTKHPHNHKKQDKKGGCKKLFAAAPAITKGQAKAIAVAHAGLKLADGLPARIAGLRRWLTNSLLNIASPPQSMMMLCGGLRI